MAEPEGAGKYASLDTAGYRAVAGLGSSEQMEVFIRRAIRQGNGAVTDSVALSSVAREHCTRPGTFDDLQAELRACPWISWPGRRSAAEPGKASPSSTVPPAPSAPPLSSEELRARRVRRFSPAAPRGQSPPADSADSHAALSRAVEQFMQTEAARSMVRAGAEDVVGRVLAVQQQVASARQELQRARSEEQAVFTREIRGVADRAAQEAARAEVKQLRSLVEAVVSGAVRKELEREVPRAVREDRQMQEVLRQSLVNVRHEVRRATEEQLQEVVREDKYHRVNRAFLQALEERSYQSMQKIRDEAQSSMRQADRRVFWSGALSATALVLAGAGFLRSRL